MRFQKLCFVSRSIHPCFIRVRNQRNVCHKKRCPLAPSLRLSQSQRLLSSCRHGHATATGPYKT